MRLSLAATAVAALLVLLQPLLSGVPSAHADNGGTSAHADDIEVRTGQVILSHDNPDVDRVDSLHFLGGLDLRSPDPRFGGLSGLDISPDGTRLIAVSDRGNWFSATVVYDGRGRLRGLADTKILPLRDADGRPLTDKAASDAESIARLADGSLVVGFERMHRLDRYDAPGSAARPMKAPEMLAAAPPNGGAEAVTLLADGRLLVLTETLEARPGVAAGWVGRAGDWRPVGFRRTGIFVPVGAATRDDGMVFLLERRFTVIGGVGTRISMLPGADIVPGRILGSREIAQIAPPLVADNFEAIAVRRGKTGETLIYIVSDDNFHDLQRNLLLLFALEE